MDTTPICPECTQGKHHNCDGTAWDHDRDELAACRCGDYHALRCRAGG